MISFSLTLFCRLPGVSPASATSRTERWPLKRSKSTKDKSPVPPTPPAPDETVTMDQQEAGSETEPKVSPSSSFAAAGAQRESKLESPQNDEAKVAASPSTISAVAQAKVLDAIDTKKKAEKGEAQMAAPSSTVGDGASPAAVAAAERRAKERAESEEAARRVDPSTGMMKSFTLADLMERNSSLSSGQVSGSSNFDIKVDGTSSGVGATPATHDGNKSAESEKQFYAAAAAALNLVGSSSSSSGTPKVPAAPATTAPSPTPTAAGGAASTAAGPSPASGSGSRAGPGPSPSSAAGSVGAYHRRIGDPSPISIVTAPKSASPAAIAPLPTPLARMRKKQDAVEASVVRVASSTSNKTNSSTTSSASGSRGGFASGGRVPDTPGSGAKAADQAKVFRRLCLVKTSSSEAETGDAGAGLGAQGREPTLSFDQVRKFEESAQELSL